MGFWGSCYYTLRLCIFRLEQIREFITLWYKRPAYPRSHSIIFLNPSQSQPLFFLQPHNALQIATFVSKSLQHWEILLTRCCILIFNMVLRYIYIYIYTLNFNTRFAHTESKYKLWGCTVQSCCYAAYCSFKDNFLRIWIIKESKKNSYMVWKEASLLVVKLLSNCMIHTEPLLDVSNYHFGG